MLKVTFILCLLIRFPVIGVGIVISSIGMLGTANAAWDWPTVRGKIFSSEVVSEMRSNFSSSGNWNTRPTEVYSALVRYEYVVDGKIYRGDRMSLQRGPPTDRYQAELTAKNEATVYYNPENPEKSLLLPEETGD